VTLGWIGSHSTVSYLHLLDNVLPQLAARYRIVVKVVGGHYSLSGLEVSNHPWKLQNELTDLHSFDIGLMPMPDDQWTRSKCGFKLLQYMGVGVPSVASPVGVNRQIVEDGLNGFLANSEEAWIDKLSKLIEDIELRRAMGLRGRATVERQFSVAVNAPRFIDALYKALDRDG
jgi:glycosyltransferase involved in cell wall biosynthesis